MPNEKVEWKDRPAEEQREMIKANLAYQINRAVTNGTSVLFDRKSKDDFQKEENIAYSGFSGKAYSGVNALLLDNMRKEGGYKRNVWLNANEAMRMGANLGKGLEKLKGLKFVEIATIQVDREVPIKKLNSNGKPMPVLDANGNQKIGQNDKPLFEYERDENGKVLTKNEPLDRPQLNTHRVYNIEDIAKIQGFQTKLLKPLKMEYNKHGGLRFMSSAHGSEIVKDKDGNEKQISTFDPNKAIVLDELANIKYKGKDKDGKEINYSLKDEVIKAVKRYYFAINFPNHEKNKGYDFPLEKRFATRLNERNERTADRLDKAFEAKQKERDSSLQQTTPKAEKKAEVAKTNSKKPIAKKQDKKKSKDMDGMSM